MTEKCEYCMGHELKRKALMKNIKEDYYVVINAFNYLEDSVIGNSVDYSLYGEKINFCPMCGRNLSSKLSKITWYIHSIDIKPENNMWRLCIDIKGLKVYVILEVRHLSYFSYEELIGREVTIQYIEKDGKIEMPGLLAVDDIFYKGIVNKN